MDYSECNLTKEEAQDSALLALAKRWSGTSFRIRETEVLVTAFGWVFGIEATTEDKVMDGDHSVPPRLVLVHKDSGQVVGTSRPYTLMQFGKIYDGLLTRNLANTRNWCLTGAHRGLGLPDIAEEARRAGLEALTELPK